MDKLALFYPDGHQAHFEIGHPERPERVEAIRKAMEEAGWWDNASFLKPDPIPVDVLQGIHSSAYLSLLERACQRGGHLDPDTYVTSASWKLANQAAGGAIAIAKSVWERSAQRGFALTRPPGHHALRGQAMGFCLLNNVALATEWLIRQEGAQKLAIVDLDLHHGNGTQDIFWERGDVLYISTHQMPLYPGTGALEEDGAGAGKGATVNFPFPPGSGDLAFHTVMDEVIVPMLERFSPQMILVSYGFDPHWNDPLGHLQLSAAGYGDLIDRLSRFADINCQGRMALFLEGGYDLDAAAACTLAVVGAMTGRPWNDPLGPSPYPENSAWQVVLKRVKQKWNL